MMKRWYHIGCSMLTTILLACGENTESPTAPEENPPPRSLFMVSATTASYLKYLDVSDDDDNPTRHLLRDENGDALIVDDLALGSDGTLWGVGQGGVHRIDTTTAMVVEHVWPDSSLFENSLSFVNALAVDPRSSPSRPVLYAMRNATWAKLLRIDVVAETVTEVDWVARPDPTGVREEGFRHKSVGDLIFAPDGTLYGTVWESRILADFLAEIDPDTGDILKTITLDERGIEGLAFVGPVLYGITRDGWLLEIDLDTGETTRIRPYGVTGTETTRDVGAG